MSRSLERLYKSFINEYDQNNNLGFDTVNYRKGAAITGIFAMEEGFKVLDNGNLEWGHVRIHSGVDRAGGRSHNEIKDVVMSPFNFESSTFEDFDGKIYGTLVVLISKKYGFEFRIAHMYPDDILILDDLKNGRPVKRDTVIGPTGHYGIGSGAHTHTEVKSLDEKNELLELILRRKFGSKIDEEYKPSEVVDFYRKMASTKGYSYEQVFNDWEDQKEKRRCHFVNRYLYRYTDFDGTEKTRYSTQLLWNGL